MPLPTHTAEAAEDLRTREIFSTDQAAEFLGCSPQTIRALATRGELRSFKLGRHLKYKRADLLRAMKPVKTYRPVGDDLD